MASLVSIAGAAALFAMAACNPGADEIIVELSPDVISSLDGTTEVTALVVGDRTPLAGEDVHLSVTYADRNGVVHDIAPLDGTSDSRGAFRAVVSGLAWEGTGTVTVEQPGGIVGTATFAVLDRTPPTVEILPPTTDLRVGAGLPMIVSVRVTDEIGVSQVVLEARGELDRTRSTVVASGATDATVTFRFDIPDNAAAGPTISLYALARDLSGNAAAATEVALTVDPTISIATPPGLSGTLLVDGTTQDLADPRAVAVSPMTGALYVADNAGTAPCNGACIREVDPTSGMVAAGAVVTGVGEMEGVAFDATGDHLYYTDRQNRVGRLTWNGSSYANPAACNNAGAQSPQDPYHVVIDPTLGILTADGQDQAVSQLATCDPTAVGTSFTTANLDAPRGIALGAAGEIFVSDSGRDEVWQVDRSNGAATVFESSGLDGPYGMDWIAGASPWADSLAVALTGGQMVVSTRGAGIDALSYLRNDPIDVAVSAGTMFILTRPSAGNRGRLYAVTGL